MYNVNIQTLVVRQSAIFPEELGQQMSFSTNSKYYNILCRSYFSNFSKIVFGTTCQLGLQTFTAIMVDANVFMTLGEEASNTRSRKEENRLH